MMRSQDAPKDRGHVSQQGSWLAQITSLGFAVPVVTAVFQTF